MLKLAVAAVTVAVAVILVTRWLDPPRPPLTKHLKDEYDYIIGRAVQ